MKRLLSLLPVAFLTACPGLQTMPPPAEPPLVGSNSEVGPAVPKGFYNDSSETDNASALAAAPIPTDYHKLPVPALKWTAPLISRFADTIAPGVVVYWVQDSSLPLASAQFVWPEGRLALGHRDDAAASLLGAFLRQGGAGALS